MGFRILLGWVQYAIVRHGYFHHKQTGPQRDVFCYGFLEWVSCGWIKITISSNNVKPWNKICTKRKIYNHEKKYL